MPWIMFLFAVVMLVASFAITALMAKKPVQPKPALLTDFEFPQSDEGQPQCVVFGDVWIPDYQILWYGNFRSEPIKGKTGKKG